MTVDESGTLLRCRSVDVEWFLEVLQIVLIDLTSLQRQSFSVFALGAEKAVPTSEVKEYSNAATAPRSLAKLKMSSVSEKLVPFVSQVTKAIQGTFVPG